MVRPSMNCARNYQSFHGPRGSIGAGEESLVHNDKALGVYLVDDRSF